MTHYKLSALVLWYLQNLNILTKLNPTLKNCELQELKIPQPSLWQYGLWRFQMGGTTLERFLPKNQHTQRKLLNFENWVYGEGSKSAKIWLSKSIFYVKSFSIFFIEGYQFRSRFFVIDIFEKISVWITFFLR